MTSLFREEALEHHARGARPGEPLRLGDRNPRRLLALVFVALVIAVIVALTVHLPAPSGGTRTAARALLGWP